MSTSWRRPTVAACLVALVMALAATASAAAAPPSPDALRINEVESGGPGFGLGSEDSARLCAPGSSTPLDSYSWTAHAVATTYGRCPNATGAFMTTAASTRGAANVCPGDVIALPWPGGSAVAIADGVDVFGTNLSGLAYQPSGTGSPGVLWAVRNGPSTLYRLVYEATKWTPDTTNGWSAGKQLRYPAHRAGDRRRARRDRAPARPAAVGDGGRLPDCGALHGRDAVFCWQCGHRSSRGARQRRCRRRRALTELPPNAAE